MDISKTNEISEKLKDPKYAAAYSEAKLFKKIVDFAKKVGIQIIYVVLLLFYAFKKPSTPKWAKIKITAALGYFILPADMIPDFIPAVGYVDDMLILMYALGVVAFHIDQETILKAKAKLHIWFGEFDKTDLQTIDNTVEEKARIRENKE